MLNLTLFAFQFGATGGGFGTLAKFKMEKRTLTSLNESSFFHLPHCFLLLSLSVGSLFRGVGSFELHVPCHACTRLTCYEEWSYLPTYWWTAPGKWKVSKSLPHSFADQLQHLYPFAAFGRYDLRHPQSAFANSTSSSLRTGLESSFFLRLGTSANADLHTTPSCFGYEQSGVLLQGVGSLGQWHGKQSLPGGSRVCSSCPWTLATPSPGTSEIATPFESYVLCNICNCSCFPECGCWLQFAILVGCTSIPKRCCAFYWLCSSGFHHDVLWYLCHAASCLHHRPMPIATAGEKVIVEPRRQIQRLAYVSWSACRIHAIHATYEHGRGRCLPSQYGYGDSSIIDKSNHVLCEGAAFGFSTYIGLVATWMTTCWPLMTFSLECLEDLDDLTWYGCQMLLTHPWVWQVLNACYACMDRWNISFWRVCKLFLGRKQRFFWISSPWRFHRW